MRRMCLRRCALGVRAEGRAALRHVCRTCPACNSRRRPTAQQLPKQAHQICWGGCFLPLLLVVCKSEVHSGEQGGGPPGARRDGSTRARAPTGSQGAGPGGAVVKEWGLGYFRLGVPASHWKKTWTYKIICALSRWGPTPCARTWRAQAQR
jgi:hypothetical protein